MKPFDLYHDVVNAIIKVIKFIRINFVKLVNWFNTKVYTPVKDTIKKYLRIIYNWIKRAVNFIVDKTIAAGKTLVDKVAKPLYLYCVKRLIVIKNIIVSIYKAAKSLFMMIIKLLQKIIVSFYEALLIILKNMNGLYFSLLLYSRKGLMGFGIIGELVFTLFGLVVMCSPSIICYWVYS